MTELNKLIIELHELKNQRENGVIGKMSIEFRGESSAMTEMIVVEQPDVLRSTTSENMLLQHFDVIKEKPTEITVTFHLTHQSDDTDTTTTKKYSAQFKVQEEIKEDGTLLDLEALNVENETDDNLKVQLKVSYTAIETILEKKNLEMQKLEKPFTDTKTTETKTTPKSNKSTEKSSKKPKGKIDSKKKNENENTVAKQSLKDMAIQNLQVAVAVLFQSRGYWIFLIAVAGIHQYGDYASV